MKRQWRIRRHLIESSDGQRRWDRAYQCLLRWGRTAPVLLLPAPQFWIELPQEVKDASRRVCTSVDSTPSSGAND